ncbi:MAG: YbaK/EbsC family protein [Acidimicrobiaceae bacterium]|nr:YbaK/EbsC family protein [Acidimicrobiaceae bacterium]
MGRRSDAIARFTEEAEASGLLVEVRTYPEGTRTAADAAAAVGCHVDQIVKSLVFMADVRPVLVLCSGGRRVDEERLARYLGTEIRIAGASEVRAATGFAIGGPPPLGHTVPLRTLVDPHLMDFEEVWAAAGTPDSVFPVKPKDLVQATSGAVVGITH